MLVNGLLDSIGNTPLIRLKRLSELTQCEIFGKAEHMNPGGSVKDRAALQIVLEAEKDGKLQPGNAIVEGTAGNTGIGLALVARARGYRCEIVMPNTMSPEKIELLEALGAKVHQVAVVPFANPENYYHVAKRLAEGMPNAFWANQFENLANMRAHYQGTGPEIWKDAECKIDGLCMAAGTGGTIAGVSSYLKEQNPKLVTYLIDPDGSGLANYIESGEIKASGNSITEGIGIMRITDNFRHAKIDGAFRASDQEMVDLLHFMLREEGIFLGGSAALNCLGAVKLARKLGPGKRIITILCDGGARYQSRLFSSKWLAEKGLTPNDGIPASLTPMAS
jgi:cysteine synthase